MNSRPRFGLISGAIAMVAGLAFLVIPSQAAHAITNTCSDCYVVTPTTAATAGAGTSNTYSFTVTNNDPNETLNTLTFTAPADLVITGGSGSSGVSVSATSASSITFNTAGGGSSFTVNVTALAPCVTQGSQNWQLSGTDSLNDTDNTEIQWDTSAFSVSLSGQCSLSFLTQPAQTAVNSAIRAGAGSTPPDLQVQLHDATGAALSSSDYSAGATSVTMSIQTGPAGATLGGTNPVTSTNGVADFANLTLNTTGQYTLTAAATGLMSATSNSFTISQVVQQCGATCTASPPPTATTATSITTTSAAGDFAAISLSSPTLTCNHYTAVSDMTNFGIFTSSGSPVGTAPATITLTISEAAVDSSPRPLVLWLVCYASPMPFPSVPGTSGTTVIGGTTYHTGVLLPCFLFKPSSEPCLKSQQYTASGGVTVTFTGFGDPYGRT